MPIHRLGLTLIASVLCFSAQAATLPAAVIPEGVGINIHFTRGSENDLAMMERAGFKVVRNDLKWEEIERYQGVYDWSAYDELAANLAKHGMRPLFILDFSNTLYEESTLKFWGGVWPYNEVMAPRRPRSVEAFSRWAAEAAKRYRKYDVIFEIWNEPNAPFFWPPTPNVDDYSRLAISACNAIHAVDPNITVVGPAVVGFHWEFLEPFFKSGALSCIDDITLHPYRKEIPESVTADYARLRELIDQYTPHSRKAQIPILSGEWGYTTARIGVPLQDQADFAVRMQLINLLNNVRISIWYDWKNDGQDINNGEHNFGTVDADLKPKPAYNDLKTLTTELSGYRLIRRMEVDHREDYVLLFIDAQGQRKFAVWTTGRPRYIRFVPSGLPDLKQMTLTDRSGQRRTIAVDENGIRVPLTNSPAYLGP